MLPERALGQQAHERGESWARDRGGRVVFLTGHTTVYLLADLR